jgi:nucleoside phosphorylase
MNRIVVIVPTRRESTPLVQRGIDVVHCGVGMAECAAATAKLLSESTLDLVILAGIAGTYSDKFAVGQTVIVGSETIADMGRLSEGEFTPLFQKSYCSSHDGDYGFKSVRSNTVNTAGGIIATPTEADIENMEGAAFFAVCEKFGIPAMEVRNISNRVGEPISAENLDMSVNRLALDLEKIIHECKAAKQQMSSRARCDSTDQGTAE